MIITLYGGKMGSGFRCHWAAAEMGVAYEEGKVDMRAGEHKSEWFLKLNPAGQVPVLVDDGFALAESVAINNYLAEKSGSDLVGADAKERGLVTQWTLYVLTSVQPLFSTIAMPKWTGVNDVAAEEKAVAALPAKLKVLEDRLAASPYLAGERFTLADVNAASTMQYAGFADFSLSAYPHITAWIEKLSARPAYVAAKG